MDTLPPETLQRIASFSSCDSVLALIRVNRHFYKTCYDNVVFKAVIRNKNGLGGKIWDCGFIGDVKDTGELARLAMADFKARTWMGDDEGSEGNRAEVEMPIPGSFPQATAPTPRPFPLLKWAPQLVTLNHPFLTEEGRTLEEFAGQFDAAGSDQQYRVHLRVVDFCFTAATLYQCVAADSHEKLALPENGFNITRYHLQAPYVMYSPARIAYSLNVRLHRWLRQDVPLLRPNKIPFREIFGIPVPFSNIDFSGTSHLPVMTSASFLQSGEWVGYYNCTLNLEVAHWDPPMKGIHFTSDPESGPYAWKASGIDKVAPFTLTGSIGANGQVIIRKDYPGFHWDWNASMTPFGIVGTWGRGSLPHGQVWLWKREWCF